MNYFQYSTPYTTPSSLPGISLLPGGDAITKFITEGLAGPIASGLREATVNLFDTLGTQYGRSGTQQRKRHSFDRCCDSPPSRCECQCCIVDADVVVYGRLGERRVIPLTIENSRRRELAIKMELSAFHSRGGNASLVTGSLLPPAPEFTIPPCGQHSVVLVVQSALGEGGGGSTTGTTSLPTERKPTLPDVDECVVSYADLCVQGCDRRPLRIAVALLPRDCGDFRIPCGCSCCC
jgi:hypothetical protein